MFEIKKTIVMPYYELNEIKSIFLKKFHKFTSNGFSIVMTWNLARNKWFSFPLKINRVLSIKKIVLILQVTLVAECRS